MICDKELELLKDKAVTSAAVTGDAVKLGKTMAAEPAVIVVTGSGLTGGTGLSVELQTDEDEAMSAAATVAKFEADLTKSPMLQFKIPYAAKEYIRLKVTPTGTFSAGTVSANVVWGPELGL